MKKTVLIALLALSLLPVSAMARDIEKGKIEITGTSGLDFDWTSSGGNDVDTYSLDLEAQYYVINNLAIGALLSWEDDDNYTAWMFGPQATYNISYDDKLSFFGNVGLGYVDLDYDDGYVFRIGGGVKYFLTNSVALVGQLRYNRLNLDNAPNLNNVNLNFGLSVVF